MVEFESESHPRGLMAAARALRLLIERIDPGLTVFLQRVQFGQHDMNLTAGVDIVTTDSPEGLIVETHVITPDTSS